MEHSMPELDGLCGRLDQLVEQIGHTGGGNREEAVTAEVVQTIQRIGEIIAWAYGQQHKPNLGDYFAQPFVDRRTRDQFKALLVNRKPQRREAQNRVAAQVLQTVHILLQATPAESMLFCNLTAGWYLNEVVAAQFDFQENEDLLPMWMTVVKDIATMLDRDNMTLFFDPTGEKSFPIFTLAINYYHHPVSQVRTHVQATSLEIFLKLRDQNFWAEPLFDLVLSDSEVFFTHVCCLLREFWRMADEAVRNGNHRDVRSALYIQNDILMYIADVFMCEIPKLSAILQDKLLRFAVLPVLLRSGLRLRDAARTSNEQDMLSPTTAWYLLHDLLVTLPERSTSVPSTVAFALLRPQTFEEVLRLVSSSPPRTPTKYFTLQAEWGGGARPALANRGETVPDEKLYAVPQVQLTTLLERSGDLGRIGARNELLEVLDQRLRGIVGPGRAEAWWLLSAAMRLFRTFRSAGEVLDNEAAGSLGAALCEVLGHHRQLTWATLEAALGALRELVAAADVPAGRARLAIGVCLREKVLAPMVTELLLVSKDSTFAAQETWLQDFQEQWAAHNASVSEPTVGARQRDLLESNVTSEPPGTPIGHTRCLRVLLGAWRIAERLMGKILDDGGGGALSEMPGLDSAELEEGMRFQPGVPVHIGKMNRVKCHVRYARRGQEQEALYLLPAQASLILVRPDEQKPFWAVPVISEPLRQVRVSQASDKAGPLEQIPAPGGNNDEQQRTLRLEITKPRSPCLKLFASEAANQPMLGRSPGRSMISPNGNGVPGKGSGGDRLAHSIASAPSNALAGGDQSMDRLAHTVQIGTPLAAGLEAAGMGGGSPLPVTLVFADERRRRVAYKILFQARHYVCQKMIEGLRGFLTNIQGTPL